MVHVGDLRLAGGEIFHHVAHGSLGNFHEQLFDRLEQIAVGVLSLNHFRARDEDLVTFAAHLLDENGDLHFAAAADVENFRIGRLRDAQGDVRADFLDQPFPDMTRGDELAVLAGERAVVDGEFHLNRRRIDRHERQRGARFRIADGFADEHVFEAGQADDVAGVRFREFRCASCLRNGRSR